MRGSLIGVGTDSAGSNRFPPLFNGVFGLKPSANRIPYGGQTNPERDGDPGIIPVAGPLAGSARDLSLFFRSVIEAEPWEYDSDVLAIPWRRMRKNNTTSLRIGVAVEDTSFPVSPPIRRALKSAVEVLGRKCHTMITIDNFPSFDLTSKLASRFFTLDHTNRSLQHITDSNEPLIKSVASRLSNFTEEPANLDDLFEMNVRLKKYREQWEAIWRQENLDVLLMPVLGQVAHPHDTFGKSPYTVCWNLLDVCTSF